MSMMYRALEGVCELSAGTLTITGLPPVFEGEIAAVQVTVRTKLNGQSYAVAGGIRAEMYLHDHYGKRMSRAQKMNISGDTLSATMPEEFGAFVGRPLLVIRLIEEDSGRILVACAKEISIRCALGQVALGLKSVTPSEVIYTGRAPYISNDRWMVWDSAAGTYVDSGTPARGPQGDPGTASDSAKLGGKAPEHYKQNRTLLINSDFENPVNTLGVISAPGIGLGKYNFINGWSTYGADATFEVGDGKILIANGGAATCGFAQIMEARFFEAGEVYTLAARVRTTGASRKYLTYGITKTASTASAEIPAETEEEIFAFSFVLPESTDGYYNFRIRSNAEAGGFEIRWMDLYKGEYTADTLPPHIPQDFEVEKLRLGLYKHEQSHVTENFRFYIDGINGNDSNDGLSADTAFKTIAKWLSLCNSGRNENRCHIVTAGNYEIPYSCFAGLALHISGQVDGVVLDFKRTGDPHDCVFYGTHYNLSNLTLRFEHDECRFETSSVILDKCVFIAPLVTFYDCFVDAQTQCTFPRVVMYGTNANLRYFVSTCTSGHALSLEKGSTARVYTRITFADQEDGNSYAAFRVIDSTLWMEATTINGSGFAQGIYTESAIVGLASDKYALMRNLATAPTGELATKPSLFIAGTTVIGGEYA